MTWPVGQRLRMIRVSISAATRSASLVRAGKPGAARGAPRSQGARGFVDVSFLECKKYPASGGYQPRNESKIPRLRDLGPEPPPTSVPGADSALAGPPRRGHR